MGQTIELDEMLSALRGGNVEAKLEFVRGFFTGMMIAAKRGLRDSRLATEVEPKEICHAVLLAFLALMERQELHFDRTDQLATYLAEMVDHELAHQRRRRHAAKRDVRRLSAEPVDQLDLLSHEPDPAERAAYEELRASCLAQLKEQDRRIFEEHLAGRTYAEIAKMLGISEGAVGKRHERLLVKLRAALQLRYPPE